MKVTTFVAFCTSLIDHVFWPASESIFITCHEKVVTESFNMRDNDIITGYGSSQHQNKIYLIERETNGIFFFFSAPWGVVRLLSNKVRRRFPPVAWWLVVEENCRLLGGRK